MNTILTGASDIKGHGSARIKTETALCQVISVRFRHVAARAGFIERLRPKTPFRVDKHINSNKCIRRHVSDNGISQLPASVECKSEKHACNNSGKPPIVQ
jgi:hypothetical protein